MALQFSPMVFIDNPLNFLRPMVRLLLLMVEPVGIEPTSETSPSPHSTSLVTVLD
jgi:hypothetical protein